MCVHLFICTYIVVLMLVVSFAHGCRQMVDPVWEHGEKRGNGWKCNYCHRQMNGGGATRLKEHLDHRIGKGRKEKDRMTLKRKNLEQMTAHLILVSVMMMIMMMGVTTAAPMLVMMGLAVGDM